MKVLIINASPRKNGVTSSLLAEAETMINSTHDADIVRIHDLTIKPCTGCLKCRPDKACVLPRDDAHILAEKIKRSDLLILGLPVYWGHMPGTLKTFFDRNVPLFEYCEAKAIRYIPRPQLKGKKAILIVSGGSPFPYNLLPSQSRGTIRSLKTILKAGGVKIVSVLNVPDSYNFEDKREHHLRKVARMVRSISSR
ncbi:MAG: flavodoxin family protein [Planctomycetota bacterium]|jgi:multimeric flavodoxin WrbA